MGTLYVKLHCWPENVHFDVSNILVCMHLYVAMCETVENQYLWLELGLLSAAY